MARSEVKENHVCPVRIVDCVESDAKKWFDKVRLTTVVDWQEAIIQISDDHFFSVWGKEKQSFLGYEDFLNYARSLSKLELDNSGPNELAESRAVVDYLYEAVSTVHESDTARYNAIVGLIARGTIDRGEFFCVLKGMIEHAYRKESSFVYGVCFTILFCVIIPGMCALVFARLDAILASIASIVMGMLLPYFLWSSPLQSHNDASPGTLGRELLAKSLYNLEGGG